VRKEKKITYSPKDVFDVFWALGFIGGRMYGGCWVHWEFGRSLDPKNEEKPLLNPET
jgi:hypothetical protein